MKRSDVISKLCGTSTLVGTKVFNHTCAHDCFCTDSSGFQFEQDVLDFIEVAVEEKILRDCKITGEIL